MADLRIIFFGMPGSYSVIPLQSLLADGHQIVAVITPPAAGVAPERRIPVIQPSGYPTLIDLASSHDIPILCPGKLTEPSLPEAIKSWRPDVMLIACYPRRLPQTLVATAKHGGYNLHPSLLPRYRGPAPLFWQFYHGEPQTGVSLHKLTDRIDAGPIAGQTEVMFEDGVSSEAAGRLLASQGYQLVQRLLSQLDRSQLLLSEQDEAHASYQTWPTTEDFCLSTNWPVRRAYNFMRASHDWGHPYTIDIDGQSYRLQSALSYEPQQQLGQTSQRDRADLAIQFSDGVLTARLMK